MFSTISKSMVAGSIAIAGLGFGAQQANADSFSVSVHTPTVSAGYSNYGGHDGGYVSVYTPAPRPYCPPPPPPVVYCPPPAPVYYPAPAPVVVYRPAPVHVCSYERRPVTRYYIECGHRVYYTDYVRVRSCDDYHRSHDHNRYDDHGRYDDHHGRGRGHDEGHGRGHGRH